MNQNSKQIPIIFASRRGIFIGRRGMAVAAIRTFVLQLSGHRSCKNRKCGGTAGLPRQNNGKGGRSAAGRSAMKVDGKISGGSLYIFLSGELDEYNAALVRGEADELIERNLACNRVVFDLSGVRFMDSTGIGFLIGRYKKLKRSSTPMYIQSPDLAADKILSMSGIYSLIPKL